MPPTKTASERPSTAAIAHAIRRLHAPHDADRAVIDLIALGPGVIPALREFLFRHRPSGIYQPARDAVSVLASLHADDVLLEYLRRAAETAIADPVDRTGEDAVINAAARALGPRRDDACFAVLMTLAGQRPFAGVIEALGEMGRDASIPRLVEGLSSDFTRHVAGAALIKFGARARPALIETALTPRPSAGSETATSRCTRRSAIGLLGHIGVTIEEWSLLKPLTEAGDSRLAALTCRLALLTGQPLLDREAAIRGLVRLLKSGDWLLATQIEGWLAENHELALRVINRAVDAGDGMVCDETVRRSLLRVIAGVAADHLAAVSRADAPLSPAARRPGEQGSAAGPAPLRQGATNCPENGKNVSNTHAFSQRLRAAGFAILSQGAQRIG